ncbi:MAG: hypothetical protein RIQ72_395 [Candidatus Parcubacteria bacterium]|jgi:hypothetical protein
MAPNSKKHILPKELQGVANIEDVNALQEQVDRCYSKDRYEIFQEAVEKITTRHLKGTLGWVVFVWIVTIVASILIQKFFKVF